MYVADESFFFRSEGSPLPDYGAPFLWLVGLPHPADWTSLLGSCRSGRKYLESRSLPQEEPCYLYALEFLLYAGEERLFRLTLQEN